ncbi:Uma2 family endonuclease [Deinococcus sp. Arct2-2]|uniref:Uma2 family endonuclease n=1 Tax=Deinococcus sp. Arct2-2 TaxID=2568653 RepID=UPI0010A484D5|nr:Uma2 family endonuclease [Deinococcus sp. Arct2-2]THF71969.1 Uma2 family endonuclease [Deinococcus sp. Arct2-2]
MSDPAFSRMSVAEYLQTEETSPVKREYVDGFVYPLHAQAGASKAHARISANLTAALHAASLRMGCRLYQSDMKLRLKESTVFFYPDILLACGPDNPNEQFETEPCILIEVLSPSTAANDRLGKFNIYTALPSLQTYLMVEQAERRVYAYSRSSDGGDWLLTELSGNDIVHLPCLNHNLSLDEIYIGLLA